MCSAMSVAQGQFYLFFSPLFPFPSKHTQKQFLGGICLKLHQSLSNNQLEKVQSQDEK